MPGGGRITTCDFLLGLNRDYFRLCTDESCGKLRSLLVSVLSCLGTSASTGYVVKSALSQIILPGAQLPHNYIQRMAAERLNSILHHLTPSKSGLTTMYVVER